MRFSFGNNWRNFSEKILDDQKLTQARDDFVRLFENVNLKGKDFLDIGFGQGLALFFAQEMGANVLGIEVDPENIKALEATIKFFPDITMPQAHILSILDDQSIAAFFEERKFDVIHAWGVLHHTGGMYKAINNACSLIKPGGYFALSIYNKHWSSPVWKMIKRVYNHMPKFVEWLMIVFFTGFIYIAKLVVVRRNPLVKRRGMDFCCDVVDWIGGYPYEYATRQGIEMYLAGKGFALCNYIAPETSLGCNEFVFRKLDNSF